MVSGALIASAAASVTIDYVSVGNPGNAADPATGSLYGAVDHAYQIGKYEVTNAQYGEFLNAKGQSNANDIYNTVTTALANHPVVYVSWYDAARFANWMMNGQGNASMENGAYTLNGATFNFLAEDDFHFGIVVGVRFQSHRSVRRGFARLPVRLQDMRRNHWAAGQYADNGVT